VDLRAGIHPRVVAVPQYTEAVNVALDPGGEVQLVVQLKAARPQWLTDEDPLILADWHRRGCLRCEVGRTDVMRAQARRFAEAAELPNVTV
jgi:hypothetical protein